MSALRDGVPPPASAWLAMGGEMGRLIQAMDWSATPLGPIEGWPQSLRTTVSLCLASHFPISIAWGPGHVQIYNDGYWPICAGKHPSSMGQDFTACWASAWPVIGEAFAQALRGETSFLEDQRMFLDRNGYLEETFFTFSFSPIRDESGEVGGLFHPVTETSGKMLAQRRTRALRDLAAGVAHATSVDEVLAIANRTIAEHPFDLPFALLYRLDADAACLVAGTGIAQGGAAAPARIALGAGSGAWGIPEVCLGGQAIELGDLGARLGPGPCGPYPEAPQRALVLPLMTPGATRPAGILVAGASPRLPMSESYRAFYDLVAATIGSGLASARALEEERRRAEALAELDRAKTAFFANVSHEFRTPLTLMLGPLEELLGHGGLAGLQREQIGLAHRNGMRLLKLVNTLLAFARTEAGRTTARFVPTDAAHLVTDLASAFRSVIEQAGLRLVVTAPPLPEAVHLDADLFERVVLNLLSNAVKFTFAGEIAVGLAADAGRMVLTVRDTGVGIPEAELPRVFERFHRVEGQRGRSHEGSGIGLALVRELVRIHGGTVEVHSRLDQGTTFTVALPFGSAHLDPRQLAAGGEDLGRSSRIGSHLAEAQQWLANDPLAMAPAAAATEEAAAGPATGACIVLADDNADMRQYLAQILRPHYRLVAVADGRQALAAARELLPDLVLSDVMMPELDGIALVAALRADPRTRDIPIVLLSARAGEEAQVEGMESGADDYLVKPFAARELLARVKTHLGMAQLRRDWARDLERARAELAAAGQRRAAEEALRASEERYRRIVETANEGIWIIDAADRTSFVNPRMAEMLGHTVSGMIGRPLTDFMAESELGACRNGLARRRQGISEQHDFRFRRQDGSDLWALLSTNPILDAGGAYAGAMAMITDITERRRLEEDLHHAQKLEAVGRLAGGIAHDFNNQLTVIQGYATLAAERTSDPLLRQAAKHIEDAAHRSAALVRQLLAFSRKGKRDFARVDLHQLISGTLEVLARSLSKGIRLEQRFDDDALAVMGDASLLQNALLNLALNARDAMPTGGELSFSTARVDLDAASATRLGLGADPVPCCRITVRDTGQGMSEAVQRHVFEPFFTTKPHGQGTGFGLASVYGTVNLHGGGIDFESAPGRGTTFRLYLPLAPADGPGEAAAPTVSEPQAGAGERILVVDDERVIAALVAETLGNAGYVVTSLSDSNEGLAYYRQHWRAIDLVVLDMNMPDPGGPETFAAMRALNPAARILIASGHSQEGAVDRLLESGAVGFISKPFRIATLAGQIGEIVRRVSAG